MRDGGLRAVEIMWPITGGTPGANDRWKVLGTRRRRRVCVLRRGPQLRRNGEAQDGTVLTGWETGYPDLHALPDLEAFACSPGASEPGSCYATSSTLKVRRADRASNVLRRLVERLDAVGFQARVGVELELHLLDSTGVPLTDGQQCYSWRSSESSTRCSSGSSRAWKASSSWKAQTPSTGLGRSRSHRPRLAVARRRRRDASEVQRPRTGTPGRGARHLHGQATQSTPETRCTCTSRCGGTASQRRLA